jgi:hypothetical protein
LVEFYDFFGFLKDSLRNGLRLYDFNIRAIAEQNPPQAKVHPAVSL